MEKRRQAIRDIVNQLGEVNFAQLKELFPEVSDVTLRKDLKFLDETQQLMGKKRKKKKNNGWRPS